MLRKRYFYTAKIDPINTNVNSPHFYKCQFVFRGISQVGIFDFLILFTSVTFLYLVKMISEWVFNILRYIYNSFQLDFRNSQIDFQWNFTQLTSCKAKSAKCRLTMTHGPWVFYIIFENINFQVIYWVLRKKCAPFFLNWKIFRKVILEKVRPTPTVN